MKCRIFIWYTIITAAFRCPSSSLDLIHDSPKICTPYVNARSYLIPYLKPYYEDYASEYVESFQQNIYTPAAHVTTQSYQKHAAPKVDQARAYGQRQWEELLKPQIESGQILAREKYESTLAPRIRALSASIRPHYAATQQNLQLAYHSWVLPAYDFSRLYAELVYNSSFKIATDIGLPYAKSTWASTSLFFSRIIWPRVRILYGENVEPQLVRIGERLGRYRDGRKLKSIVKEHAR